MIGPEIRCTAGYTERPGQFVYFGAPYTIEDTLTLFDDDCGALCDAHDECLSWQAQPEGGWRSDGDYTGKMLQCRLFSKKKIQCGQAASRNVLCDKETRRLEELPAPVFSQGEMRRMIDPEIRCTPGYNERVGQFVYFGSPYTLEDTLTLFDDDCGALCDAHDECLSWQAQPEGGWRSDRDYTGKMLQCRLFSKKKIPRVSAPTSWVLCDKETRRLEELP